jgi:cytochrome c oxidase subunit 2
MGGGVAATNSKSGSKIQHPESSQSAIRNPMSRFFAIAFWFLALSITGFFAWSGWWLPESIAAHSELIDRQFKITFVVIGMGFVLTHAALGYAIWGGRERKNEGAIHSHGDLRVEIILVVSTTLVFITLAVTGQRVWAQLKINQSPPDAIQIEVTGQQFAWNFRYPGGDGRFGRTDPRLYDDADRTIEARPGPLGIDPGDPLGNDDIVTGTLVIPVNRPVNLLLRAKDVTHDFYVPALRLKHDAVPGMRISIHFMTLKEGRYEIACAELCGQLHHQMRAILEVKSQGDYEDWLRKKML